MSYKIEVGGQELLDSLEPLWQDLFLFHIAKSKHFKEDYRGFRLENRKKDLLKKSKKGSLRVSLSKDEQNRIFGYCVSSILVLCPKSKLSSRLKGEIL